MSYDLGDIAAVSTTNALAQWIVAVKQRGNISSLMPAGPMKGRLAEKIPAYKIPEGRRLTDPNALLYGSFWYVPASAHVQSLYNAEGQANRNAIARDKFWDSLQPSQLLKDAGTLAREGVSAVTGIPTWAIPVLLIGAGAFVLHSVMSSIGDGVRKL